MTFTKSIFISVLYVVPLIILYACANQMSPTGGPKDETPPILTFSIPEDKSLNYKGTSIELNFDEPIQVFNLKSELIITPTYSGDYDFRPSKYGVQIDFEEPFNDSTTWIKSHKSLFF